MNNEFYPMKCDERIAYVRSTDKGTFILNEYSIGNKELCLNETGEFIFNHCDGKNSIQDIINKISEEFHENNIEVISKDTYDFLHIMWSYGILIWTDHKNPFQNKYELKQNSYTYCMGNMDLLDEFIDTKANLYSTAINDARYNENAILDKDFLLSLYLNGANMLYVLKKENTILMRVIVNIDIVDLRIYIKHIDFSVENEEYIEEYSKFIDWIAKLAMKNTYIDNKNMMNILMIIDSDDNNKLYLDKMGFSSKGKLRKEVYINEVYKDVEVYVKTFAI